MFLQVRFHHPGCVLSVGHDTAEEKAEKCFEGEEEEEMWAPHWAWKGRVVTIHSEPSSCQTRGWSRHPAPPQLMNDENHTRGWSHSCQLQWGYPKEKAHKNQAENMMCLQVITVKVLNQTDPMSSSSSSPHSVNQSKTKPGFSTCHSEHYDSASVWSFPSGSPDTTRNEEVVTLGTTVTAAAMFEPQSPTVQPKEPGPEKEFQKKQLLQVIQL